MKNGPYHSTVLVGSTAAPFVKAASCGFGVSLVSSPLLSGSLFISLFYLTCLCHPFQLLIILFWPLMNSSFSCDLLYSFVILYLPPPPHPPWSASLQHPALLFPPFLLLICSHTLFSSPCSSRCFLSNLLTRVVVLCCVIVVLCSLGG